MEVSLEKLTQQEAQYVAELDEALMQYAELQQQTESMDAVELGEVRQTIRPNKEHEVLQRLQVDYGKRFDPKLLTQSRKDISALLGKDTEQTSIHQELRQTTGQQERPYRTRKLNRER